MDVVTKTVGLSVEENEVYVNITLSSLPFSVLATEVKSNIAPELTLPLTRASDEKSQNGLNIQDSKVVNYCTPEDIPPNNCENVNQRIFCDSECVALKSVCVNKNKCTISENSNENQHTETELTSNEDIMSKIKQVSQFLKIPDGMQVREDERNEAKIGVKSAELIHARDNEPKLVAEVLPGITDQVDKNVAPSVSQSSSGITVVSKGFEVKESDENLNVKPVKNRLKQRKNYEELAPFKFFCSICSFKSKRESHYQRHLQLHSQVSQLFACDKCNFKAIRLGHLRRHELSHSSTTLACNLCHYKTNNQKFLAKHKRIKHEISQVSEGEKEILHCKLCDYSTSQNHFLQRHQRVHGLGSTAKTQQSYQCEQCPYKTGRREHLLRHTSNVHGGQRPFLCHRCGKAFKRQDALKQHAIIHMFQANVMCPVCGKGCRSQIHLAQHLAVHSAVRSFLCELCGSAFKTRAVQRKHIQTIHQHPKAFFCHHCSRKFNTKYALRRHIKQHSSERKAKPEDQTPRLTTTVSGTMPDVFSASMRMLQADAIFIQDAPRNHLPDNSSVISVQENPGQHDGDKITVQLAESYDPETLRVIPSHTYVQHSNETATALLYLTGNFTPY